MVPVLRVTFLNITLFSTPGPNVTFILLPPCVVNIKSQHRCLFSPRILPYLCIRTYSLLLLTFYSAYNIVSELLFNHLPDRIESSVSARGHVCQLNIVFSVPDTQHVLE